ncbi:Cyclohexane-1,2-dione hydrolase [Hartmannibacter diazotrophicus]|uniref:Cyclohexane-1,2-dione hydrolase n=1 Tax=Hartmannibacter diazotrophicus TaxID=1482074 RepID=A0A2C9DCB9_9HYPH|nr:thiamine pyrophosphate-binding protein [Hartmannibacter diazotrophicus]SON57778.1 Cyclohexane-1,2-dione hydrolase [Hartmannibacter diazotrophicus]
MNIDVAGAPLAGAQGEAMPTGVWQSDVIADLIRQYGFPFITLNPGASYRGLHDSLVNHNGDTPPMLVCQHEKVAVQIAHGYAKATGEPLAVIVHNVVGLLHATMGIYYAYTDRAPVFVIGATGPMDEGKRRPRVDWAHTANVQGTQIRDYVKWDYQPGGIDGVADSFARAWSIMMTEPRGPIYMCYDAALQEAPLEAPVVLPSPSSATAPSRIAPDPDALETAADMLVSADWPVLLPQFVGRDRNGFADMVRLAETLGAPVVDTQWRLNFPTEHPLDMRMDKDVFRSADLISLLDCRDWERPTHVNDRINRTLQPLFPPNCKWLDIGFADIEISKWATDYQRFPEYDHRVLADTALALPALDRLCAARIAGDERLRRKVRDRAGAVGEMHARARQAWREQALENWDAQPITLPRLASEVWDRIRTEDWVLTTNAFEDWALKLWDFDRPYRWPGKALGTGTQIGMATGIALAHRGTGRLVVDCQTDGDLMFDVGALWFAAKHKVPFLCVMHNNRAYYNDWEHQITVARQRKTPEERAYIGMDIMDPAPDFSTIARGFGWYAEGPIEDPGDIGGALERAIAKVKSGVPALVDTITQHAG